MKWNVEELEGRGLLADVVNAGVERMFKSSPWWGAYFIEQSEEGHEILAISDASLSCVTRESIQSFMTIYNAGLMLN